MKLDRFHGGLILAALVAFAFAVQEYKSASQSNGALRGVRAKESILLEQLAEAKIAAQADGATVYVRSDIVHRLRDTLLLNIHDTVRVREFIAQTDTLRSGCDALRKSCLVLSTTTDSVLAAKDAHIHILEARQPSFLQRHWPVAVVGGVIAGAWLRGR